MPTLEETLRDALRRQKPTRDAGEVFDHLADRRRRRAVARKLGTIGLVVAVLGGTAGAFALLGHTFGTNPTPLSTPTSDNGALVVSLQSGDGLFLYVLPPEKQDLAPAGGGAAAGSDDMRYLTGSGAERDVEPAVSPGGATVAYVRHAWQAPGALWTVGIDGTNAHRIVDSSVDVADPAWSPDGTWIAFTGVITDVRALYLVRPDGSDLHALPFTPQSTVGSPAWSPDGTSIVISASPVPGDGPSDLWVIGSDGSALRNVTSTTDVDETDPAWSPDGAWIAFVTADGIERMPAEGGVPDVLVSAPTVRSDRLPTQPAWSPDGRYLAFAFEPPAPLPPVVYVLPVGGTTAFPLTQGWSFGWQPIPANGATQIPTPSPKENLGLGYAVCRVTSMPITTSGGPGAAYVFTRRGTNGCPERADAIAGVDVDNDGAVDATYGPIKDCFFACEAFAAPDINADGTSEIAVSTAGADGYGVSMFAMSSSGPPRLTAIPVYDPQDLAHVLDPLQFAWVDVATHFEGARCGNLDDGTPTFILESGDKLPPDADVRSTTLVFDGTTATVVDVSNVTMPLADAPVPENELCGAPLHGSAAAFPAAVQPGIDIGIGPNICNDSHLERDLDGNGTIDTVWVGSEVRNGRCPDQGSGRSIVAVDLDGDGRADGSYTALPRCDEGCGVFAATDLDADGTMEVVVALQRSSTPEYAVYGLAPPTGEPSIGIVPLIVHPGNPTAGIEDGTGLTFFTGGDEGDSFAVECADYPSSPTLVLWRSTHPVEGPGSDVQTVDFTRLQLRDGMFAVIDTRHFTLPTREQPPYDQPTTACGVDWA